MNRDWREQSIAYLELEDQFNDEDKSVYNLSKPESHCPNCQHKIRWFENLPIISYLFLKGKCSNCKNKISIRYPTIELATALISVLVAKHFGWSPQLLPALILTWGMIAMVGIDFDHQLLPDSLTLPLLWLGLLVNTQSIFVDPVTAIIGAVCGYLSLYNVISRWSWLTGNDSANVVFRSR